MNSGFDVKVLFLIIFFSVVLQVKYLSCKDEVGEVFNEINK